MLDLITIGDVKLDTFLDLNRCKQKCDLAKKKIEFAFGEKITVDTLGQQIAGSAPNVATALARMGKKTAVISQMGNDFTYRLAMEHLPKEHVETKYIRSQKGLASASSVVLSLQGEKTILASYIHKPYKLPSPFPETKWLYLSEMGNSYEKLYEDVLKLLKKKHILLGFNPGNEQIRDQKPVLFQLIANCKTLFVNLEEGKALIHKPRLGLRALAAALFNLGPIEVVITDGRNGSYGFDGSQFLFCPIFPGERIESTGAGDSFAAAYLGAKMFGVSMSEAMRWGSVNSASVVHEIGPTKGLLSEKQIRARLKVHPQFQPTEITS